MGQIPLIHIIPYFTKRHHPLLPVKAAPVKICSASSTFWSSKRSTPSAISAFTWDCGHMSNLEHCRSKMIQDLSPGYTQNGQLNSWFGCKVLALPENPHLRIPGIFPTTAQCIFNCPLQFTWQHQGVACWLITPGRTRRPSPSSITYSKISKIHQKGLQGPSSIRPSPFSATARRAACRAFSASITGTGGVASLPKISSMLAPSKACTFLYKVNHMFTHVHPFPSQLSMDLTLCHCTKNHKISRKPLILPPNMVPADFPSNSR